jgi:hypothetical protein
LVRCTVYIVLYVKVLALSATPQGRSHAIHNVLLKSLAKTRFFGCGIRVAESRYCEKGGAYRFIQLYSKLMGAVSSVANYYCIIMRGSAGSLFLKDNNKICYGHRSWRSNTARLRAGTRHLVSLDCTMPGVRQSVSQSNWQNMMAQVD